MSELTRSAHSMTSWDGTALTYRAWRPLGSPARALILFHRGHEHGGRFADVAPALVDDDCAVFAWDARGHGGSAGARGHAPSFAALVRDADAFVRHVVAEHKIPVENVVVLGHSVGAVIASAWVHDYAPRIRALILASPAFRVRLYVPWAVPLLRLGARVRPGAVVRSYVTSRMLTHDAAQQAQYDRDPLITRAIAVNVLLGLHDAGTRLVADAQAIRVPTLVLVAGADRVVRLAPQRRFFAALGSPVKEMRVYPGLHHDLFHERDRAPLEAVQAFVRGVFRESPGPASLLEAHRTGASAAAHARLAAPLPFASPKRLYFAGLRLVLETVGRLSRGVQIGWRHGFDSGTSLDYVYRNVPGGLTPLGRWLDRIYLDRVGWRAIRHRKASLQRILHATITRVHGTGAPVRLVDIAAGPGRYVLETLQGLPHIPVSALLRDTAPENLAAGRALARALGLAAVTYARGDAFDRGSLAAITPPPTIAIASGLYELVPDNARILASLRGLHDALADGGSLVYTNQPWHPQLELIARTLVNRDKAPWAMRCRSQAEMDELVRAAGFEKTDMEIDDQGIFTVSVARKRDGR